MPRNDIQPPMQFVQMPLDQLKRRSRKIRKRVQSHMQEVAASIAVSGQCDPVLLGKKNRIIDGEIRVDAAELLGLDTVPCVRVEHLSDIEERRLALSLNRLGEKGEWDIGVSIGAQD